MEEEQKKKYISQEVRGKVAGYIGAGIGVVAGLAWNDAIAALIAVLFPLDKSTIIAKFLYAIVITVVVVIIGIYAVKLIEGKKK